MRMKAKLLFVGAALVAGTAAAQEFDACTVFTPDDASKALGVPAEAEPLNPKVKRPKVIPACTYTASKDGKPLAATASFKWGKTDAEAQRAFDDARMQYQTKPLLISGADAFWSAKLGEMMLRKGRTVVTVAVGPKDVKAREENDARKLAEILARKM